MAQIATREPTSRSHTNPQDSYLHTLVQTNLMDARRHGFVDVGDAAVVEDDSGVTDLAGVVEDRLDQQAAAPEDDGAVVQGVVVGDRDGQRQVLFAPPAGCF